MKGLFYRELYLQRKGILAVIITFFVFNLLGLLLYLSMLYGNLGKIYSSEEDIQGIHSLLFGIFTYFSSFIIMLMPAETFGVIASDYAVGWMRFQRCMPYKPVHYTLVKMGLMAAELLVGFVLAVINAFINRKIYGVDMLPEELLLPIVLLMVLCCGMSLLMTILTLLTRSKTGVAPAMVLVALYVAFMFALALLPEEVWTDLENWFMTTIKGDMMAFLKKLVPWALGIIAVLLTGSFFAMNALFKRREK